MEENERNRSGNILHRRQKIKIYCQIFKICRALPQTPIKIVEECWLESMTRKSENGKLGQFLDYFGKLVV